MARVDTSGECWLWLGAGGNPGYGNLDLAGRHMGAHRASWILHNGEIPDGLWVLHHCDTLRCVRPDHLYLGTPKDNHDDMVRRGRRVVWNQQKTHCKNGHEFAGSNLYVDPEGFRRCRTCRNRQSLAYQKRRRARSAPE